MRIAIVLTSPNPSTKEYQNVWNNCPQKKEIAPYKLVIEGTGWNLHVFDGMSNKYHRRTWNYEIVNQEITDIVNQHLSPSIGIFLHGSDRELNTLTGNLETLNASGSFFKCYGATRGKFYKRYVKPFSSSGSDDLFEKLWAKLAETLGESINNQGFRNEIDSLAHDFSGIPRGMRFIIEDAKDDIKYLQEFKNFDFDSLLQKYISIEPRLMDFEIEGIEQVHGVIENIVATSQEIPNKTLSPKDALSLAQQCLATTETVCDLLNRAQEVVHD